MTSKDKIKFLYSLKQVIEENVEVLNYGLCSLVVQACNITYKGAKIKEEANEWLLDILPEEKYNHFGEEMPPHFIAENVRLGVGGFCFPKGNHGTDRERFYYYRLRWIDEQILKLKNND